MDLQTNQTIQITKPIWGIHDQQWIDNKTILVLSDRASADLTQLFQFNLSDDIRNVTTYLEPVQITSHPLDIDNLLVNRQGTRLAFSCQVYSNLSIEETFNRKTEEKKQWSFDISI